MAGEKIMSRLTDALGRLPFGKRRKSLTPSGKDQVITGNLETDISNLNADISAGLLSIITGENKTSITSGRLYTFINKKNNLFKSVNQLNKTASEIYTQVTNQIRLADKSFNATNKLLSDLVKLFEKTTGENISKDVKVKRTDEKILLIFDKSTNKSIDDFIKAINDSKNIKVNFSAGKLEIDSEYFDQLNKIFDEEDKAILKVLSEKVNKLKSISFKLKEEDINNLIKNILKISDIDQSKITVLKDIIKSISEIEDKKKNFNNVTKNINGLNSIIEELNNLQQIDKVSFNRNINKIASSIDKIDAVFKQLSQIQSISNVQIKKITALKELGDTVVIISNLDFNKVLANVNDFETLFTEIDRILTNIKDTDYSEKITVIKEHLKEIKDLYDNDIIPLINVIDANSKNLDKIKQGVDSSYDVVVSGSQKIKKNEINSVKEKANDMAEAIALLGMVMLIGGLVISKNEKIIYGSLVFGAVLTAFLLELMIPITLLKLVDAKIKGSAKDLTSLSGFLLTTAFIMLLGGYIASSKLLLKSLQFGIAFSAFLLSLIPPIMLMGIVSRLSKSSMQNLKGINGILLGGAFIMLIGSYIIENINIANALKFGVVLGLFIVTTLMPVVLCSLLAKQAVESFKDIKGLIVVSALLMIFGSYLVDTINTENALKFGLLLGAFIFCVVSPLILFGLVAKRLEKKIKELKWFMILTTIIMMIGASLASDKKFVDNALGFGLLLFKFIMLTISPILLFSVLGKRVGFVIFQVENFILESILLLTVGSLIVNKHPEIIEGSLKFALHFTLFITALILPLLLLRRKIRQSFEAMAGIALVVLVGGAIFYTIMELTGKYGFWKMLEGALIFTGFLLILVGGIKLISKITTSGEGAKAAAGAILMAVAIGILALSLIAIKKIINKIKFADVLTFLGMVGILTLFELALSTVIVFAIPGILGAIALGISITILAGSLMLVHMLVNGNIDFDKDFAKLQDVIIIAGNVFRELGRNTLKIIGGSIAGAFMGIGLAILSLSFFVLHTLLNTIDPEEDFNNLNNAIIVAGDCFAHLGLLAITIIPGTAAAILLSVGLLVLAGSFALVHVITKSRNDYKKDIEFLLNSIDGIGSLFGKIILQGALALLAAPASLLILTTITSIDLALTLIKGSESIVKDIKDPSFTKAKIIIKNFLGIINDKEIKDSISLKIKRKARQLRKISHSISSALKDIIDVLIKYKDIKGLNIESASANISTIISTMITAVDNAYKTLGSKKRINEISTKIKSIYPIGNLITKIAEGLQSYANLKFPIYDNNGNVIGYEKFTDFKGAGDNIATTMTVLIDSVSYAYDKLGEGKIRNIRKKIKSVMGIGNLIASIAEGLRVYSELKFPVYKTNSTEVQRYLELNETTFVQAANNISTVIGAIVTAVENAYDNIVHKRINQVKRKINALAPIGDLIAKTAEGIQAYANLKFPVYKGKEVVGYKELTTVDFGQAALNIGEVLTTMVSAVEIAYETLGMHNIRRVSRKINSLTPIGNLISQVASGIQKMANLKFPMYNADGSIIPGKYETLDNRDFTKASKNIKDVIVTIAAAVDEGYDKIQKGGLFDARAKKKINTISELSNVIYSIARGIQAYAKLQIPTYDANGNFTNYEEFKEEYFKTASKNIKTIITNVAGGVLLGFLELKNYNGIFGTSAKRKIKSLTELGNLISSIAEGIQSYVNLKIPIYDPETGKVTGYKDINQADFTVAAENIKTIITTVAGGVWRGFAKLRNYTGIFGSSAKKKTESIAEIGNLILNVAKGIEAYADLKIPIYDEKTHELKGYRNLDPKDFTNAQDRIVEIVTNTAKALSKAYNELNIDPEKLDRIVNTFKSVSDIVSNTANSILSYATGNFTDSNGNTITINDQTIKKATQNINILLTGLVSSLNSAFTSTNSINDINISEDYSAKMVELINSIGEIHESVLKYTTIKNNDITSSLSNIKDILNKLNEISLIKFANIKEEEINTKLNALKLYKEICNTIDNELLQKIINLSDPAKQAVGTTFGHNANSPIKNIETLINNIKSSLQSIANNIILNENINKIIPLLTSYKELIDWLNTNSLELTFTVDDKTAAFANIHTYINNILSSLSIFTSKKISNIHDGISKFNQIVNDLIEISAKTSSGEYQFIFTKFNDGINSISDNLKENIDDETIKEKSSQLSDFVKVANKVDMSRIKGLTALMDAMSRLADKVGGLDKLTELLSGDFKDIMEKLGEKVENAEKTIQRAEQIEKERQQHLNENIEKLGKLMNQHINVNIENVDDNNEIKLGSEIEQK